jgi:amidophosphoribosyltransferase
LVVVDDSIVRGTTTPQIVAMLRNAGASEIHMRVCAPPIQHPCHFGVDMAKKHELLAAQKNLEEIRQFIDSDTLEFLSLDGAVRATGDGEESFCTACFSGRYPIPVQLELDKFALEN